MKNLDILKIIKNIEINFDVNSLKYDGICIWPILRSVITNNLLNNNNGKAKVTEDSFDNDIRWINEHSKNLHNIKNELDSLKALDNYSSESTLKEKNFLYFADSTYRSEIIEGKHFHKFADSLHYILDEDINILEYTSSEYFTPKYYNAHYIEDIIAISKLENSLDILKNNLYNNANKDIENFFEFNIFLNKMNLSLYHSKKAIVRKLNFFMILKNNYKKLLKIYNPKIVFLNHFWAENEMALVLAAKELGIKSVDIQHGFTGEDHLFYKEWSKMPVNGYSLFPDFFWTWNHRTENMFNLWVKRSSVHKVLNGGNIWLSLYKEKFVKNREKKENSNKTILFTLQPIDEFLPDILELTMLKNKDFKWLIRLHPNHPSMKKHKSNILEKLNTLQQKSVNIEWENSSKEELYKLLELSDIHITCHSTVAFEALEFGLKTILIHNDAKIRMNKEIEDKVFNYAETEEEIENFLLSSSSVKVKNGYVKTIDSIKEMLKNILENQI